ncbi:MAG: UDP-N-acetylmuramate dehydrogenase [Pseudomonadota bacterium]|nr:UDP-N-acetylmuramate dehydrogenase [Pseudomonadota bacterium]MEC8501081.1 UDP-N-acetylmuramate dehydrogenase [Pseudomonadota bacterium]
MNIIENFPVPNTLALTSVAEFGCLLRSGQDIVEAKRFARTKGVAFKVIGAGSNLVPLPKVRGVLGVMASTGVHVIDETNTEVLLEISAGQNWHELVMHCVGQDWFGIENLALIPGLAGAAPVQNIGAYGVELADVLEAVQIVDAQNRLLWLSNEKCGFGYRSSRFQGRTEEVITALRLRLSKLPKPCLTYPELADRFTNFSGLTAQRIADAVIAIRTAKLPDPTVNPNVGSFFKNPIINSSQIADFEALGLSTHNTEAGVKLSAAQLIDRCGWKEKPGKRVGCWPHQPLVLVNYDNAEASHILEFANDVRASVAEVFAVQLETEPSVLS